MIDLLLELLVWYIIFRVVIWFASAWNSAKQEVHDKMVEKFDEITHRVKIEKHNNQSYWYDQDDDMFLAQGVTTEEIIEKLKSRFPDHFFFLEGEQEIYKLSAPDWKMELHRAE